MNKKIILATGAVALLAALSGCAGTSEAGKQETKDTSAAQNSATATAPQANKPATTETPGGDTCATLKAKADDIKANKLVFPDLGYKANAAGWRELANGSSGESKKIYTAAADAWDKVIAETGLDKNAPEEKQIPAGLKHGVAVIRLSKDAKACGVDIGRLSSNLN